MKSMEIFNLCKFLQLNEIKECSEHMNWTLAFVLQNLGFLTGFGVILLLAFYE